MHTATYLLSRRPTKPLHLDTPYQALFHQVPDYTHLRTFGCLCFPNLTSTTQHKLSPRSTPCLFLGYSQEHKGYRCLDLSTKKIIISRHVIFDEQSFPMSTESCATGPATPAPSAPNPLESALDLVPVRPPTTLYPTHDPPRAPVPAPPQPSNHQAIKSQPLPHLLSPRVAAPLNAMCTPSRLLKIICAPDLRPVSSNRNNTSTAQPLPLFLLSQPATKQP